MKDSALYFALLTVCSLLVQSFYAMSEMACVSFNKVRLQYYISKKKKRAIWLSRLIKNPARLFGTTLIGVNAALQFGSEAARRFYASIDLSPDFAPLTQVVLVLLLAELSPMFAGRRYAEHVAMLGIPFIYLSSKVLAPLIWFLDILSRGAHLLLGISTKRVAYHLSRQELQKAIEGRDEPMGDQELNSTLSNIFSLREKVAKDLMQPLQEALLLPSDASIATVREKLAEKFSPSIVVYQSNRSNVIGVTSPRDLLRLEEGKPIQMACQSPWFITQKNSIFQILKQFRWNNQSLAVVLDDQGRAEGILTLDLIVKEIFRVHERDLHQSKKFIDRTFSGSALVGEINRKLSIELEGEEKETLEELCRRKLGHHPAVGESVRAGKFELSIEEATLLEVTKVRLQTLSHRF